MKLDSLGLNHFVFGSATAHAVAPLSSALSSVHSRAQPPQSSSLMPRFFLYHSPRAFSSVFALMNTPPIPVILAICFPLLNRFLSVDMNTDLQFQIVRIAETALIHEYFKRHAARVAVPHATTAVCADSDRSFFLRIAAEINVIANPTGNGSTNVYHTL